MYEVVRRRFSGQMMDLIRIPKCVWKEAIAADKARQAWHGSSPKANHWAGKGEQVLGNAAEIMARRMLDHFGATGWQAAPLFNNKFSDPVHSGGSPSWDIAFGPNGDEWRKAEPKCKPGWFGVETGVEVKTTGCGPREVWILRVKDEEFKPHSRLVIFATMMVAASDPTLGDAMGSGRLRSLPQYMLPFHYITSDTVSATPPTPNGQPFAPHKACRVFPFPGFRRSARVTAKTVVGPELKPLTKEAIIGR